MHVTKVYERDLRTQLVSEIFDMLLVSDSYPFESIELHVRDMNASSIEDGKAVICVDYNDPFVPERDVKGIRTLLAHELLRLMFKFDVPRDIEDVMIGREMVRRGLGEDLCYLYYNRLLQSRPETVEAYIRANLPWIIFAGHDKYNSELLKKLASKVCKKKFACKRLFDFLLDLSQKNLREAVEEYKRCKACK